MPNLTQDNFYEDKSVTSTVKELYNNFIPKIDEHRSYFDATVSGILQSNFSLSSIDKAISNAQLKEAAYSESRCHTFYRMIGLPIVDINGNIYCPGFDKYANRTPDILNTNINIGKNTSKDSQDMSFLRERYYKDMIKLFENKDNISTAYILASTYIRPFNVMAETGPLEKDTQSYTIEERDLSKDNLLKFDRIKDSDGNTISYKKEYKHILKPFIVDPRIDCTVLPAQKRIAVPFTLKREDLKLDAQTYLLTPLIETVCRARLNLSNKSDQVGTYRQSLIDYIKSPEITDPGSNSDLANALTEDINKFSTSETLAMQKFINIMRCLARQLDISINNFYAGIYRINYNPIADVRGPEFGCTLGAVIPGDTRNTNLERDIAIQNILKEFSSMDLSASSNVEQQTVEAPFSNTSGGEKNVKTGYDKSLKSMNEFRNKVGAVLNTSVTNIEMIMGEFSGLGLIDIVAILATLWTIEHKYLVNMLDQSAFDRLYTNKELRNPAVEDRKNGASINGLDVISEFERKVKQYLDLEYTIFQSLRSTAIKEVWFLIIWIYNGGTMSFDLKLSNKNLSLVNGKLEIVTSSAKLIQDVLKVILTPIGTNPSFPWYGCALIDSISGSQFDPIMRNTLIKSQIETALNNLMGLQSAQRKTAQPVSNAEHIAAISNIAVTQDPGDPRGIIIRLTILTKAFNTVTTSFSVSIW